MQRVARAQRGDPGTPPSGGVTPAIVNTVLRGVQSGVRREATRPSSALTCGRCLALNLTPRSLRFWAAFAQGFSELILIALVPLCRSRTCEDASRYSIEG